MAKITIDIDNVKTEVKGGLAMMGKRLPTKNGGTLYTSSTLSSVEEKYLTEYLKEGVSVFLGEFTPAIIGYTTDNSIHIDFNVTRINGAKITAFADGFIHFLVEYIQFKALGLSLTEEARKDKENDLQRLLNSAIKLMFTPDPPKQSGKTLSDMTGEVILI